MDIMSYEVILYCPSCGLEIFTKIRPQEFKKKDMQKCSICDIWMEPWEVIRKEYFPEDPKITEEKIKSFIELKDLFRIYTNLDDFHKEKGDNE